VNFLIGLGLWVLCAMIVAKIMYNLNGKLEADSWTASMLMFWPIFVIGLIFVGGFKFLVWIVKF